MTGRIIAVDQNQRLMLLLTQNFIEDPQANTHSHNSEHILLLSYDPTLTPATAYLDSNIYQAQTLPAPDRQYHEAHGTI